MAPDDNMTADPIAAAIAAAEAAAMLPEDNAMSARDRARRARFSVSDSDTMSARPDFTTLIGITAAFGLLIAALGISAASTSSAGADSSGAPWGGGFFNLPSALIVLGGTAAVTIISFAWKDVGDAFSSIAQSVWRRARDPMKVGEQILDLAQQARLHGRLVVESYMDGLGRSNPFLSNALTFILDETPAADIERIMESEIAAARERAFRAANVLRRAAEVAPAMGLIGTLIGLVQMLIHLDNPKTIGPAMALAILTTFYGAVIGNMLLAPLAAKIERSAEDDTLIQRLYAAGAASIARQENPRRLETVLNTLLPAHQRVRFFD
jgi:chemotaxis protein MotA